jgi:hypothetical protein
MERLVLSLPDLLPLLGEFSGLARVPYPTVALTQVSAHGSQNIVTPCRNIFLAHVQKRKNDANKMPELASIKTL